MFELDTAFLFNGIFKNILKGILPFLEFLFWKTTTQNLWWLIPIFIRALYFFSM